MGLPALGLGQPGRILTASAIYTPFDGSSFGKALPLKEEVGDRAGESVTRYNMAMIYRDQGKLQSAVEELRQVVELDTLVQGPDLESDKAMLAQLEEELGA